MNFISSFLDYPPATNPSDTAAPDSGGVGDSWLSGFTRASQDLSQFARSAGEAYGNIRQVWEENIAANPHNTDEPTYVGQPGRPTTASGGFPSSIAGIPTNALLLIGGLGVVIYFMVRK